MINTDQVHRRRWATLVVLCLALAIIGLDTTVLNVALPTLQRELDTSASELQWIVDAYTVVFAGLLLIAGAFGDKYGRKRWLLLGLGIFGVASVWGALCTTPEQLIAARAVMGVGGAVIMPSTLSILTNAFTNPKERKTAIGIWSGVSGLGIALGPALGGWLLEHFSWASVFVINIPVAAVAFVLGAVIVPESRAENAARIDFVGGLLSVVGLVALVWSIIEAPERGWSDPLVIAGFAAAVLILVAFALWELRVEHPMLDIRFFKNRRFSIPTISITLVFFALMGSAFFLSIYLQTVQGYDALGAGIRILPLAFGLTLGAPLAMAVAQRVGEKIPVVAGLAMLAVSFVVIAGTSVDSTYGRVLLSILLMGFGMGFAMSPATEAVMGSLPKEKAGVGSAVNDAVRQVGGALGVAVLGSILNSAYANRMASDVAGLPPEAAEAAEAAQDNIQSAVHVASQLPGGAGAALVDAAEQSFVGAMDVTVIVACAVVLAGGLLALLFLPHHASPAGKHAGEPPAEGEHTSEDGSGTGRHAASSEESDLVEAER